jgi:mono/diheme cytochrome c family protein
VRQDGAHLFPALPYTHFAMLSDEDVHALYAYVMTSIEPVAGDVPANTLPAPYSWRALQGGWKLLFVRGGAFEPDPDQSAEWNRGYYLAEGLGHCSACHSPRNSLGAEETGAAAYAGAVVEGWYAPAINAMQDAKLAWTEEDLYAYLRVGASPLHGVATGTMSEVIHAGLSQLPDEDIRAIAVYFAGRNGAPAEIATADIAAAIAPAGGLTLDDAQTRGELIYVSYCVSCHFNRPDAPSAERPDLAANSAVVGPDPTNFLRVVMRGVSEEEGNPDIKMPGFRYILSDRDVGDVASYLRAAYAVGEPGWGDLSTRIAEVRAMNEPLH